MALMASWDIVVVGGANIDHLAWGSQLPRVGETVEAEQYQQAPGGKGANQAVAAARLGARVALVARIGRDAGGDLLHERLQAEGVGTRFLVRDAEAPTGVALILVDHRGRKQIMAVPAANHQLGPADLQAAADAIKTAKVVLIQLEVPLDTVRLAAALGRDAGARVVLDPAPAQRLPADLLALIDVIKPNSREAEVLTGIRVQGRLTAREAAKVLIERGVGAVAVEAGRQGNLIVWHDGEHWLPLIDVDAVDATGAGDAFAAALSGMLAEGRTLVEAGEFASAAAALATTKLGAQAGLPERDAVFSLLAQAGGFGGATSDVAAPPG